MPSHFPVTTLIVISNLIFAFWHVSTVHPDIFQLHEIVAHGTDARPHRTRYQIRIVQYRIRIFRYANSRRPIFGVRSAVKPKCFCIDTDARPFSTLNV